MRKISKLKTLSMSDAFSVAWQLIRSERNMMKIKEITALLGGAHRRRQRPAMLARIITKTSASSLAGMISLAFLLVVNTGCGSTKVSTHNNTNASVGQQLLDLEKAHNQGLISDKDYDKLK